MGIILCSKVHSVQKISTRYLFFQPPPPLTFYNDDIVPMKYGINKNALMRESYFFMFRRL